jgi:hypothetical protein
MIGATLTVGGGRLVKKVRKIFFFGQVKASSKAVRAHGTHTNHVDGVKRGIGIVEEHERQKILYQLPVLRVSQGKGGREG